MRFPLHYLLDRASEASTWRHLVLGVTYFGFNLTPDQNGAVVDVLVAVFAALGTFVPDKVKR